MAMPVSAEPRHALARLAGGLVRRAADALLPPACFACGEPVATQGLLCAACFPKFRIIGPPHCHCCGLPFAHAGEAVEVGLCARCLEHPPVYERARAAWIYDEASKPLILAFKYGDRTDLAPAFARAMAAAGATLLADADLIAPVPLHRLRLIGRRYNQAALLAHELGAICGKPVVPSLLVRARRTAPLADLSARARRQTLAGAISVPERFAERVAGAHVLLVDDVLTSGATADACAEALLAAGAGCVDLLTIARTRPPGSGQPLDGAADKDEVVDDA